MEYAALRRSLSLPYGCPVSKILVLLGVDVNNEHKCIWSSSNVFDRDSFMSLGLVKTINGWRFMGENFSEEITGKTSELTIKGTRLFPESNFEKYVAEHIRILYDKIENLTLLQKGNLELNKEKLCKHDEALQNRLALQTAKAMDTLHSSTPPVIHRDIKSANVIIDRNYNARLGDFGLALRGHVDDYRLRSPPPADTMGYLDPCYVTPDNLSTKTDVFSFGISLLEIISGKKAIDITYSPPSIMDWAIPLIKKGKLLVVYDPRIVPPKDPVVRKQLAMIAAKCVRSCRERRPSMKEVVTWLCGLCKLVPLHSWNGFNNPCMMVETVGRPVEARNDEFNSRLAGVEEGNIEALDGRLSKSAMRYSRRVYSDLKVFPEGVLYKRTLIQLNT
ncbi:serine/threonine-protein kinase-like protein At3g51990 [Vigna radiata var. radiata]|uniref:Serine/threonine-protein kinase-like protein At3g51990 n=1 Tax=Vigna radiata var. radiata TaxID=3916 RepID=A0A1S3VZ22_VIGRR|nr:serine/threonine-protein kinase-like protein At3g51990 [Vigna radiata var. radiata]